MDSQILDRYNTREGAKSYRKKFQKHWTERINNIREQHLVRTLLNGIPKTDLTGLSLDMPCGYGRLCPLVQERTPNVVECDWSFFLLQESQRYLREDTKAQPARAHVRATALNLPYRDNAFDLVVSVRLCHHISTQEERLQYLREILRVSRRWVMFTYFDTHSLKSITHERRRQRKNPQKRPKWTLSQDDVATMASEAGYRVVRSVPLSRLFSGHRYEVLVRDDKA